MSLRPLLMTSSLWIRTVDPDAEDEQSRFDVPASTVENIVIGSPCFLCRLSEHVTEQVEDRAGREIIEHLRQGFLGLVLVHGSILPPARGSSLPLVGPRRLLPR